MPMLMIRSAGEGVYQALLSNTGRPPVTLPGGGDAPQALANAMRAGWSTTVDYWTEGAAAGASEGDAFATAAAEVEPFFTADALFYGDATVFEAADSEVLLDALADAGEALLTAL